jgi:GTP-binding protein
VTEIYGYLAEKRQQETRSEETHMVVEAQSILSIDPDDPRFKILD